MSNWTYNLGIPNPPNKPSNDVNPMQVNTNSIANLVAVDHVGFNANNGGYHTLIHQIPRDTDPGTIPGISQLYSKIVSGDTQLFFETGNGGISQLTGTNAQTNGSQWIGGTLLQWGTVTLGGGNNQTGTVTFATSNIDFPNNLFNVSLTLKSNTGNSSDNTLSVWTPTTPVPPIVSPSKTGFSWKYNGTGSTNFPAFFWMAIGN